MARKYFEEGDIVQYIGSIDDNLRGRHFKVELFYGKPAIQTQSKNHWIIKYKLISRNDFIVTERASVFTDEDYETV